MKLRPLLTGRLRRSKLDIPPVANPVCKIKLTDDHLRNNGKLTIEEMLSLLDPPDEAAQLALKPEEPVHSEMEWACLVDLLVIQRNRLVSRLKARPAPARAGLVADKLSQITQAIGVESHVSPIVAADLRGAADSRILRQKLHGSTGSARELGQD